MTTRDVQARAIYLVDKRRVHCDCSRSVGHAPDCAVEVAWTRAMRQAASQLRREESARFVTYARAV